MGQRALKNIALAYMMSLYDEDVFEICLNQFVVHEILGISYGGEEAADSAHVEWEVNGSKDQACSDQFASGKPIGSLYYPRIVTNILWFGSDSMKRSQKNVKT